MNVAVEVAKVTAHQSQAATPAPASKPPASKSRDSALEVVPSIRIDRSRDALLTDFGKATLEDRYLLQN
ncbi:MAG: hypothetical protein Q8M03_05790, partial [Legionella sp.]|nr:hypothetical protein [Legionella sp.]